MFILTSIDVNNNLVRVYDTKDSSNEVTKLNVIAQKIAAGKLKVYGLGSANRAKLSDSIRLDDYGIYVSFIEAKEAMASEYMKRGLDRTTAFRKVGLL